MKRKTLIVSLGAVSALGIFLWAIADSDSFRNCEHERKFHRTYHALHEDADAFVKTIARGRLLFACGFVSTNENTGAISGIGTVVIGIFTFTLWWSTHKLWQSAESQRRHDKAALRVQIASIKASIATSSRSAIATERAAEAAASSAETAKDGLRVLERPYIYISHTASNLRRAIVDSVSMPERPWTQITIKNFGRTPAIIEQIGLRLRFGADDRSIPNAIPRDLILGPTDTHPQTCFFQSEFSPGLAAQVADQQFDFWITFEIRYRDVFGMSHETSGDWKYFMVLDEFHPESGARYRQAT
jgi:hypothetical protein